MQWTHLGNIHSPYESIVVTMFLHKFTTWWWLKRCCHLSSIILPRKVLSVGFKFCLCHDNKIGLSIFPSSECQSVKSLVETNTQPVNTSHRVHVSTHWRQNYHQYKDHALQIVGNGVSGQLSTFFVCREIWSLSVHRFFAGYSIPGMQAGTTGIYDKCFAALDN